MTNVRMPAGGPTQESGGSYLANVSDLMASLLFVFILMLAFFAHRFATDTADLRAESSTLQEMLGDIGEQLEDRGIEVTVVPEQGVLRFSENAIGFESGAEFPLTQHGDNVGALATVLMEVVPRYLPDEPSPTIPLTENAQARPSYCGPPADLPLATRGEDPVDSRGWFVETILIEGHTDNVPVTGGTRFRNNRELSSFRSARVHEMLAQCEPGLETLLNTGGFPILASSGYGEVRPIDDDLDGLDRNRRIDLRFLMERLDLEGTQDLVGQMQDEITKSLGERLR